MQPEPVTPMEKVDMVLSVLPAIGMDAAVEVLMDAMVEHGIWMTPVTAKQALQTRMWNLPSIPPRGAAEIREVIPQPGQGAEGWAGDRIVFTAPEPYGDEDEWGEWGECDCENDPDCDCDDGWDDEWEAPRER